MHVNVATPILPSVLLGPRWLFIEPSSVAWQNGVISMLWINSLVQCLILVVQNLMGAFNPSHSCGH